jgi:hypothetical protein
MSTSSIFSRPVDLIYFIFFTTHIPLILGKSQTAIHIFPILSVPTQLISNLLPHSKRHNAPLPVLDPLLGGLHPLHNRLLYSALPRPTLPLLSASLVQTLPSPRSRFPDPAMSLAISRSSPAGREQQQCPGRAAGICGPVRHHDGDLFGGYSCLGRL